MNISGRLLTLLGLVVLSGCYIDPGPPPLLGVDLFISHCIPRYFDET
jgi:hypothetical protein